MRVASMKGFLPFSIFLAGGMAMGGCAHHHHHDDGVVVVDEHGFRHEGNYDEHHRWHGGYYDERHEFHADADDWHR